MIQKLSSVCAVIYIICHFCLSSADNNSNNEISTIPDVIDVLNISSLFPFRFIGTQRARQCLSGKKLVFLGDSTTTEQVHDIAILLAGIGGSRGLIKQYMQRVYATRKTYSFQLINLTISFYVRQEHRIGQRNMGHWDVGSNNGGIKSFSHSSVTEELDWFIGSNHTSSNTGNLTDFLILNSGAHDSRNSTNEFTIELDKLLPSLKERNKKMIMIWRGSIISDAMRPTLGALDMLAQDACRKHNVTYVNSTAAFDIVQQHYPNGTLPISSDGIHFGTLSIRYHPSYKLTVSSLATQILLQHICPGFINE